MSDLGDTVMRGIIKCAEAELIADDWSAAYYRGQISIVENYMEPDAALVEKAKRAVDEIVRRRVRKESQH